MNRYLLIPILLFISLIPQGLLRGQTTIRGTQLEISANAQDQVWSGLIGGAIGDENTLFRNRMFAVGRLNYGGWSGSSDLLSVGYFNYLGQGYGGLIASFIVGSTNDICGQFSAAIGTWNGIYGDEDVGPSSTSLLIGSFNGSQGGAEALIAGINNHAYQSIGNVTLGLGGSNVSAILTHPRRPAKGGMSARF